MGIVITGTVGDGDKFVSPCSSLVPNQLAVDLLFLVSLCHLLRRALYKYI